MSDERDKKRRGIFAKISPYPKRADGFLFFFLCSLLILGFVVPSSVHYVPYGTDVYTHIFYTHEMASVNSLSDFYENCFEKSYLIESYNYPFGLRLFGSIVMKITDVSMLELSILQPFTILIILIILYYSYAKIYGLIKEQVMLSVAFLLSMPIISLYILGYETDNFVIPFLIVILYLAFIDKAKISIQKRFILINLFILCLSFSHTGTYMFLMLFFIAYLLIYAALYGDFHQNAYIATSCMMFVYIITMHLFPYVHSQYIDKGRILVSIGNFISSDLHVPFASELAQMFYEQIFVALNPLYVVLWCISIYAICRLFVFLHTKIKAKVKILIQKKRSELPEKFLSVPIIGSVRHMSHSMLYWPFWLGPVQVALAAIGAFRTNRRGLCMFLAVAAVTLLPAHMTGERALREIHYLFLIIPILAASGFYYAKKKIEIRIENKSQKVVIGIVLLGLFSSIIVPPAIGNLYYHPLISGTDSEIGGLRWLSDIGTPGEGCAGLGYRYMISVYANKMAPGATSVAAGSESGRFYQDYRSVCLHMNSEEHADDLYTTFGVNYLIISDRVLRKGFGVTDKQLRVDYNKQFDKIYSSSEYFSAYRYIPSVTRRTKIISQLNFADSAIIEDAGGSYLVETDEYKVRISKGTPEIQHIGNKTANFLGEGGLYDFVLITWSGPHSGQVNGYVLQELSYSSIILGNNQIIYKTVLKNENRTEDWATLTVKYTFFDKAMKREMIVANDWVNDSEMNVRVTTMLLTPMKHFIFQNENNPAKKRTMYPCEDEVPLDKIKFNRIFINDSTNGIYLKYEKTAPYSDRITYSGLISYIYEYYSLDMSAEKSISPSETMHLTQWISIGDEQTAKNNVEQYSSISLYPYPDGEIPVILMSRLNSLNTSSEDDFANALNAHEKFREVGVANYTEAVSIQDMEVNTSRMSQLLERGAYIIGCDEVEGRNITAQEEKIKKILGNAQKYYKIDLKGFMPKGLRYDLETIKVLADQNLTFIAAKKIMPAFDIYFQEGLRRPQMAYYHGDATNLVLLPVSEPTIGGPTYFYDDYPTAWKAVIDSVIKNEDLCVFLWDSDKAGKPEYINDTMHVIKYAKDKGMTFTTPHEIANHFLLLQNVSAVISKSDDGSKITISVSNGNEEPVHGVTFRVEVPGTTEYAVKNGQISRKASSGTKCIYYVSTDLAPKETKDIVLDVLGYR